MRKLEIAPHEKAAIGLETNDPIGAKPRHFLDDIGRSDPCPANGLKPSALFECAGRCERRHHRFGRKKPGGQRPQHITTDLRATGIHKQWTVTIAIH